ncbi:hypothetical protein AKJ16_DCAP03463 [Drosera capensis]
MFTEGLDENAINWVTKGADAGKEVGSPPSDKLSEYNQMPRSPLVFTNGIYMSPSTMPSLNFHSCLIGPHRVATIDDENDSHGNFDESVGSATPTYSDGKYQQEVSESSDTGVSEMSFGCLHESLINRGSSMMNLKIEVPSGLRRFSDADINDTAQRYCTSSVGAGHLRAEFYPKSAQGVPGYYSKPYGLGSPSAPPMQDIENERNGLEYESEKGSDSCTGKQANNTIYMSRAAESSEETKQVSVESAANYDDNQIPNTRFTTRSTDGKLSPLFTGRRNGAFAPETKFQNVDQTDSSMGYAPCHNTKLHKFCLHSRHTKPVDAVTPGTKQSCPGKIDKVVGKMRVEVKKLRVIPRRKLKGMHHQRGSFYVQAGAEYMKQVSTVMRNSISSIMNSSLPVTPEEKLSCFVQLKSSTDDRRADSSCAICLLPGTGDHHEFFPESEGDALIVEVKDRKQTIQGQAVVPVSVFTDNHAGPVVETLAYDLLLEAAMRTENLHARNLRLQAPWNWLLAQFSDYYAVSVSYTQLRYLSFVMNVATPTKDCLELVMDLLLPVVKARNERRLNRQEKSILMDCESQVESLLAHVFENYKSLDELSPSGLSNTLAPAPESAPPALDPAVQVYTLLHDILAQDAQTRLQRYLQVAVKRRCQKLMLDTEELLSANLEDLLDPASISTSYSKMKNLCMSIGTEIHGDIMIHNEHILPSAIDLPKIASGVYSAELGRKLRRFLAACPPSSPLPHVNELLVATTDFERNLESWNISGIEGGVESKILFNDYIITWIQDMELRMLDVCKEEKIAQSGVLTTHSTSLFVENIYLHIQAELSQYDVVMSRWPQYSLVMENAIANAERVILKTLEKQYCDILAPLKESLPKKLGIQVQKLARRQSITMYAVPQELGTFLNTVKRILEVLHVRVEDRLKPWASCLPTDGDSKSSFGEQMTGFTVLLRTKYKTYIHGVVAKLYRNLQASRCTQMKRILDETEDSDGEAEIRERMQTLSSQLMHSISNLHEVLSSQIFIAVCRGFWDRMGQSVSKFLEGRKENRIWYKGSYYALGILDDIFASQMQRLRGNALQKKDLEPPRSVAEARSIFCRDGTNGTNSSTYVDY